MRIRLTCRAKYGVRLTLLACAMIMVSNVVGCSDSNIQAVRSSTLLTDEQAYFGNVTIGSAVEAELHEPQWDSRVTQYDQHIVTVEGGLSVDGRIRHAEIEFHFDPETGEVRLYDLLVEGQSQSDLVRVVVVASMFSAEPLFEAIGAGDMMRVQRERYRDPDFSARTEDGESALLIAARKGHRDIVGFLLDQGADVNRPGGHGITALHVAARDGRQGLATLLLERGADPNAAADSNSTPLMEAAVRGRRELVDLLVRAGAELDRTDRDGLTAAALGYRARNIGLVGELIEHGASPDISLHDDTPLLIGAIRDQHSALVERLIAHKADVTITDDAGRTPLHAAIRVGDRRTIHWLLEAGAPMDARDRDGARPLTIAADARRWELVAELVEGGADPNVESQETPLIVAATRQRQNAVVEAIVAAEGDVDARDHRGRTALHVAAELGRDQLAQRLAAAGATLDAENTEGQRPLAVALANGHVELAISLTESGADPNVRVNDVPLLLMAVRAAQGELIDAILANDGRIDVVDADGNTVVHAAVESERIELVQRLAEAGALIDQQNDAGITPLAIAVERRLSPVIEHLLANEASPNVASVHGRPLVVEATIGGRADLVGLLIEHDGEVTVSDDAGRTPLHYAVAAGDAELTALLIDNHADVNTGDDDGRTPLAEAVDAGDQAMVTRLLEAGADAEGRVGGEPLTFIAARGGHTEIAQMLLDRGADAEARNRAGDALLHVAATSGSDPLVTALLEGGAEVDRRQQSERRLTPLHVAVAAGHASTVKLLIEHGADVDAQSASRESMLAFGREGGDPEVLKHLLREGVRADNEHGQAILTRALLTDHERDVDGELIRLLVERGADINATDEHGRSLLELVMRKDGLVTRDGRLEVLSGMRVDQVEILNHIRFRVENLENLSLHRTRVCLENGATPSEQLSRDMLILISVVPQEPSNTEFGVEDRMAILQHIEGTPIPHTIWTYGSFFGFDDFERQMFALKLIERCLDLGVPVGTDMLPTEVYRGKNTAFFDNVRALMLGEVIRSREGRWSDLSEQQREELGQQSQATLTKLVNAVGVSDKAKELWRQRGFGGIAEEFDLNVIIDNAPSPKSVASPE